MDNQEAERLVMTLSGANLQREFSAKVGLNPRFKSFDGFHIDFFLRDFLTGHADLSLFKFDNEIVWTEFYPVENIPSVKKRGLGTLAMLLPLIELNKRCNLNSKYNVTHSRITEESLAHLNRLGIKPVEMPLRDYFERAVNYANSKGFRFTNPLKRV